MPASVYFHFPAWSAVGRAVQLVVGPHPPGQGRRHVSCSLGRTAGSPGTPAGPPGPQITSEASVPPLGLPPGGPPFPQSPLLHALCVETRGCQNKNAENMNVFFIPERSTFLPLISHSPRHGQGQTLGTQASWEDFQEGRGEAGAPLWATALFRGRKG